MSAKEIIVFYSWESELPKETNLNAIRNELRSAANEIEAKFDVKIVLDEACKIRLH